MTATILTDEQIEQGREAIFSTNNPFCPCDSKTMRKAARWAEQAVLQSYESQLLRLLVDIRFAAGDDGKRMQPELVEHIAALRKDAERYRFLRSQNLDDGTDTTPWISAASTDDDHWGLSGEIADSRIDAAMEKQP